MSIVYQASCTCTYIVYSVGTKVKLQIWNNDKVKCNVFYP